MFFLDSLTCHVPRVVEAFENNTYIEFCPFLGKSSEVEGICFNPLLDVFAA